MEKGKLLVKLSRNGYFVEVQYTNGRKQPCPGFKPKNDELNGKDVEIERTPAGAIRGIYKDGVLIYPEIQKQTPIINQNKIGFEEKKVEHTSIKNQNILNKKKSENKFYNLPKGTALAPYNFVPLNNRVITLFQDEVLPQDRYYSNRYTGYIELEIMNKTPLYIRGKDKDNPKFFNPTGQIAIPGSSLRGMIRSLVEIVTNGKFLQFDDKRLYYRALADVTNLRKEYNDNMSLWDRFTKSSQYKMKAGILKKINQFEYEIIPVGEYKKGFYQIKKYEAEKRVRDYLKVPYKPFNFYEFKDEYIVVSGDMQNKKNDWIVKKQTGNPKSIELIEEDINDYRFDSNKAYDILVDNRINKGYPIFYVEYETYDKESNLVIKRISFGHTPMFRLAYKTTIGEHIPEELQKEPIIVFDEKVNKVIEANGLDYANAMFGFVNSKNKNSDAVKALSGRLFFTDAMIENMSDAVTEKKVPKILSGPKPTTFQHYLEQNDKQEFDVDNKGREVRDRNHYNSEVGDQKKHPASIRGYKLYWHKNINQNSTEAFEEKSDEIVQKIQSGEDKQHTYIETIKIGNTFKGKIHFENLSDKELGALLFVLDLPEGCCHKIGMGKSLGLGSIHIKPTVYFSDRKDRYSSLQSEWKSLEKLDKQMFTELKKKFEEDMIFELRRQNYFENKESYWDYERMQELKELLDFENKPSNFRTRYMEIQRKTGEIVPKTGRERIVNEFSKRPILSQPTKYKD